METKAKTGQTKGPRGRRFPRAAFSLVELLVVTLIVAVFALFAGPAYLRSSRLERNLRDEAYARTQLVLDLERIAREVSLAKSIAWEDPATGVAVTNSSLPLSHPATNYVVRLLYPEETGGVSFETNRISQVSSVRLALGRDFLLSTASNRVDLVPAEQRRFLRADPVFVGARDGARMVSFCITNVVSGGEERSDLLHATLSSAVDLDEGNGRTTPKTISVDRLMRMWNR